MVKPNPLHEFFRDVTTFGGLTFYLLILIATLIFSPSLFFPLLLGLLISTLVIVLIRLVYFKARPLQQEYSNFIERLDASSFPSLHTARIFFLSFYFSYIWNQLHLTIILLFLALLVSYSRIHLQKHDWWDLLGGIILAALSNFITLFLI